MGEVIFGPPSGKVTSMPMASAVSRMSANTMAASTSKSSMGSRVTSAASSGVRQRSRKDVFERTFMVAGEVAAGLAHHPDGEALDGLATQRTYEEGSHELSFSFSPRPKTLRRWSGVGIEGSSFSMPRTTREVGRARSLFTRRRVIFSTAARTSPLT